MWADRFIGNLASAEGPARAGSFVLAMTNFHHAGAFVVQFREVTDFERGRVEGRVEHIASGRVAYFTSMEELREAFAQSSKSVPAEHPKSRGSTAG